MFDSRIDETKVRQYDEETKRYYSRIVKEDHFTLTDGEGRFLVHITKPEKVDTEDEISDTGDEAAESVDDATSGEPKENEKNRSLQR